MALSARQRFDVLKRDGFTCQYCGRRPPEVVLHVDHIVPRVEGGRDEAENFAASCSDCNLGKGPRPLVVVKACAFCGRERAGAFFELVAPEHLDQPLDADSWSQLATWELVCRTCVCLAVRFYVRSCREGLVA